MMGRSNYTDDGEYPGLWRGAVQAAINGKRGQAFLKELVAALDAMPVKQLIAEELEYGEQVCAIGSVGKMRGVDMSDLDPYEYESIATVFKIAPSLVQEIEYMNDEYGDARHATPERRWELMREWAVSQIKVAP